VNDQPTSQLAPISKMQVFREWVAAILSIIVILGAFSMIAAAFYQYARVKDLLLFINPLLGVIIGYYFNKVSSDLRAETAEMAARTASVTA